MPPLLLFLKHMHLPAPDRPLSHRVSTTAAVWVIATATTAATRTTCLLLLLLLPPLLLEQLLHVPAAACTALT
jgi:hypothetical protein